MRVFAGSTTTRYSGSVLTFDSNGTPLHVFYCLWEEGTPMGQPGNVRETPRQRLAAAWAGNRGLGQRSIEAITWGFPDLDTAFAEFQRYLQQMVVAGAPGSG